MLGPVSIDAEFDPSVGDTEIYLFDENRNLIMKQRTVEARQTEMLKLMLNVTTYTILTEDKKRL